MTVTRTDALQTAKPRATHKIHEHRLHAVVTMVSHTDTVKLEVLKKLIKISVAQFTGCHLDTDMMQQSILTGIEVGTMQGYAPTLAQPYDKMLVAVRLVATQTEVTMGSFHLIAQSLQHNQQCHAVGPATQSHQIAAVALQQLMSFDICLNLTQHKARGLSNTHLLGGRC